METFTAPSFRQRALKALPFKERFWRLVEKTDGCWLWRGGRNDNGYGRISDGSGEIRAHRHSWAMAYGSIPAGKQINHRCDNPACVRPDHLYCGSHAENMRDAKERGRLAAGNRHGSKTRPDSVLRGSDHPNHVNPWRMARGERHGMRLHPECVSRGEGTEIAPVFGVSKSLIGLIKRGAAWRHVA